MRLLWLQVVWFNKLNPSSSDLVRDRLKSHSASCKRKVSIRLCLVWYALKGYYLREYYRRCPKYIYWVSHRSFLKGTIHPERKILQLRIRPRAASHTIFRMIPEGLYNRTKLYGFFLELDSHGHYELSLHRKHSLKILFFSFPQKNNSIQVWDDMGE